MFSCVKKCIQNFVLYIKLRALVHVSCLTGLKACQGLSEDTQKCTFQQLLKTSRAHIHLFSASCAEWLDGFTAGYVLVSVAFDHVGRPRFNGNSHRFSKVEITMHRFICY